MVEIEAGYTFAATKLIRSEEHSVEITFGRDDTSSFLTVSDYVSAEPLRYNIDESSVFASLPGNLIGLYSFIPLGSNDRQSLKLLFECDGDRRAFQLFLNKSKDLLRIIHTEEGTEHALEDRKLVGSKRRRTARQMGKSEVRPLPVGIQFIQAGNEGHKKDRLDYLYPILKNVPSNEWQDFFGRNAMVYPRSHFRDNPVLVDNQIPHLVIGEKIQYQFAYQVPPRNAFHIQHNYRRCYGMIHFEEEELNIN